MKYINLTPHPVYLMLDDKTVVFEPEERPARVAKNRKHIVNLPEYDKDTILIVSEYTRQVGKRKDLRSPFGKVRTALGVIGCRVFKDSWGRVRYS